MHLARLHLISIFAYGFKWPCDPGFLYGLLIRYCTENGLLVRLFRGDLRYDTKLSMSQAFSK